MSCGHEFLYGIKAYKMTNEVHTIYLVTKTEKNIDLHVREGVERNNSTFFMDNKSINT
jgi:hypothetical protein